MRLGGGGPSRGAYILALSTLPFCLLLVGWVARLGFPYLRIPPGNPLIITNGTRKFGLHIITGILSFVFIMELQRNATNVIYTHYVWSCSSYSSIYYFILSNGHYSCTMIHVLISFLHGIHTVFFLFFETLD